MELIYTSRPAIARHVERYGISEHRWRRPASMVRTFIPPRIRLERRLGERRIKVRLVLAYLGVERRRLDRRTA